MEDMPELVIVSGMSGAGRTEAMHVFEDLGYFCVDNLPASLIGNLFELGGMAELPGQPAGECRIAVVCDARNRSFFSGLTDELHRLDARGIEYRILFLDASDEKLIARYKSSRRRHPLCEDGTSIEQGIQRERNLLFGVRELAHDVIDTTAMLPQQLRATIRELFATGQERRGLAVTVYSFGFKHGAPRDADLVMDVRFLPNPYYDPALRPLTGLDAPVRDYVMYRAETIEFEKRWRALLDCVMPGYVAEGKQQLAIAVGCTGGQHRSVALAESTGEYLKAQGYRVSVAHRDLSAGRRLRREQPCREGRRACLPRRRRFRRAGRRSGVRGSPWRLCASRSDRIPPPPPRSRRCVPPRLPRARASASAPSSSAAARARPCPSARSCLWGWRRAPWWPWPTTGGPPASCARRPTSRRPATCASASPPSPATRTTRSRARSSTASRSRATTRSATSCWRRWRTPRDRSPRRYASASGCSTRRGTCIPPRSTASRWRRARATAACWKARPTPAVRARRSSACGSRAAGEATPYRPALDAIRGADLVVLGPGSLFTSIIPNLLVPGIVDAVRTSRGHVLFVCSLADMQGETWGLTAREHVEALMDHGMRGLVDYVLVHTPVPLRPESPATDRFNAVTGAQPEHASLAGLSDESLSGRIRPVPITYHDAVAIQQQGPVVIARNLVDPQRPTWHDPRALRDAFSGVLKLCRSRQR